MVTPSSESNHFERISNQIATLQESVNSMSTRLSNVETIVADHSRKLEHQEDQLERLGGQLGSLREMVVEQGNQIGSLRDTAANQSAQIGTLLDAVTTLKEHSIRVEAQIELLIKNDDDLKSRMLALEHRYVVLLVGTIGGFLAALAAVVVNNIFS